MRRNGSFTQPEKAQASSKKRSPCSETTKSIHALTRPSSTRSARTVGSWQLTCGATTPRTVELRIACHSARPHLALSVRVVIDTHTLSEAASALLLGKKWNGSQQHYYPARLALLQLSDVPLSTLGPAVTFCALSSFLLWAPLLETFII